MSDLKVRIVNNITKEYPNMYKIVIYKEPKIFISSDSNRRKRELVDDSNYVPKISSLNRTKTLIRDIVLCNNFELFCTFTFDPKKVDSFSLPKCWQKMSSWINHQRDNSKVKGKEFFYLIIPEQHVSGRWHFHALISGYTGQLKDSGCKTASLRPVYNITSFRSGFTTATPIDSKESVSNYVTKYITKDFVKSFNQRRFFCSRNLVRPSRELNSRIFSFSLPIFRRRVSENNSTIEYIIDKYDFPDYNQDKSSPNVVQYGVHDFYIN